MLIFMHAVCAALFCILISILLYYTVIKLTGDTRKIFVYHSARVLIGCKPIKIKTLNISKPRVPTLAWDGFYRVYVLDMG